MLNPYSIARRGPEGLGRAEAAVARTSALVRAELMSELVTITFAMVRKPQASLEAIIHANDGWSEQSSTSLGYSWSAGGSSCRILLKSFQRVSTSEKARLWLVSSRGEAAEPAEHAKPELNVAGASTRESSTGVLIIQDAVHRQSW